MPSIVSILLASIGTWVRSRVSMQIEIVALRHQVAVYKHTGSRPRLRTRDRVLWVWLSRLWPGWQDALAFVQPRTVIAWQQKRFRHHWRRLSQQGQPGQPVMAPEVREAHPGHVALASHLGLTSHRRGTAHAGSPCGQINRGEVSSSMPHTLVTHLAGLPAQPCQRPRGL